VYILREPGSHAVFPRSVRAVLWNRLKARLQQRLLGRRGPGFNAQAVLHREGRVKTGVEFNRQELATVSGLSLARL